jgi:hypothetical protein
MRLSKMQSRKRKPTPETVILTECAMAVSMLKVSKMLRQYATFNDGYGVVRRMGGMILSDFMSCMAAGRKII